MYARGRLAENFFQPDSELKRICWIRTNFWVLSIIDMEARVFTPRKCVWKFLSLWTELTHSPPLIRVRAPPCLAYNTRADQPNHNKEMPLVSRGRQHQSGAAIQSNQGTRERVRIHLRARENTPTRTRTWILGFGGPRSVQLSYRGCLLIYMTFNCNRVFCQTEEKYR